MKVVITGPPCSGKTTVVEALRRLGYLTVGEMATSIIEEGLLFPWVDRDAFQREVLQRQLQAETELPQTGPIFLDRGIYDESVIYRMECAPLPEFLSAPGAQRYALAFVFEILADWQDNGVRFEDLEYARAIAPLYGQVYSEQGVPVVPVPAASVQERIDFVLANTITRSRLAT